MIGNLAHSADLELARPKSPGAVPLGTAPSWSRQHNDVALVSALTIAAHDLRGPLANLSVLIELIEAYGQKRAFEQLPSRTRQAQRIIEALDKMLIALLERARSTGDPLGYVPSIVSLNDVVKNAFALNHPLAESRSVQLHYIYDLPLTLWGDERLLLQAIENIISNAVKFSRSGTTVVCETERDGDEAVIRIADQGQGLNKRDVRRAFRPFSTLSSKPEHDVRSWGLGLWICRLIVERHGGCIDAETASDNGGAVFTLRLPMTIR